MQPKGFQALMALFDSEIRNEVFLLMDLSKVKNYTHFVNLHGSSEFGKKENSVTWPGSNEIVLLIISSDEYEQFMAAVKQYKQERKPAPPLLILTWDLKELL